ncbi:hypothetical protein GYMLUDRAFT_73842 [Collybiopsis luxurians FD-317 M1]|uniref:C2H2-type domain-containing protein n=1 Tax=Collybiopsis luxurians FD-317 M1 TaxID=944289 RepID=A0A0D0B9N4_9AGAR|nr:hypothetical protein GYMLUDRAFT_73842 [Collybiopsis luxurians FD-317 M1]
MSSSLAWEMPFLRFPRIALVNEYLRYCQRYYLFYLNSSQRPSSFDLWYRYMAENYPGNELEGFESWFWGVPQLPPLVRFQPVPPEAEYPSPQRVFQCFYPGCNERYRTKQYRDNHFDKIHLGFRYLCDLCHASFMNKGSVKKHKDWGRCPMTKSG